MLPFLRKFDLLARQLPSTFSSVIFIRLRSMRGSGSLVFATDWSTNSSTTALFLETDWTAESSTVRRRLVLDQQLPCAALRWTGEYMSLNSPVAPSRTCLKFSSTLLESMLVRIFRVADRGVLSLHRGPG